MSYELGVLDFMFTHFQHVLGKKILLYILLCSSVLTMATALIQLYSDYQYDMDIVEERINEVDSTHLKTLALNLWDFQDKAINQQLEGLVHIAAFQYVVLTTPHGDSYTAGTEAGDVIEKHNFDVTYNKEVIGQLTLSVNYDEIYQKLRNKVWLVLTTQFVKTLLVALCIMMIVYWLVTRHIYRIVEITRRNSIEDLTTPVTLEGDRTNKDELDLLAQTLNEVRLSLKHDFEKRQKAEQALQTLNTQLESIVADRTVELEATINSLELTQKELVQSEKMASLGQLVAGVSHEINTPLGIVVTATSGMRENVTSLESKVSSTTLKKSHLLEYIQHQKEALAITEKSLERAVNLINNFKTVSVNQSSDTLIETQMASLVGEVTNTVQTLFKQENYQINTTIAHDLILTTYPGAWAQIITNLLMNSHIHGFEHRHQGNVSISLTSQGDEWLFTYQDNGVGIPEDMLDRIFDPFVTTKRGKGGSGLGLNIVFNLVYSLLQGSISVENLEQGCRFTLKGPIMASKEII